MIKTMTSPSTRILVKLPVGHIIFSGHATQLPPPEASYVPAAQVHSAADVAPGYSVVNEVGQDVHAVWPTALVNMPGAHRVQSF